MRPYLGIMTNGDKLALAVFGAFGFLCAVALTIPFFREVEMSRGLFDGVPVWIVLTVCAVLSAVTVCLILINTRRIRRGQRPL